jgi:hypothetical protein
MDGRTLYIEGFGLSHWEARMLLQSFNGCLNSADMEHLSYRRYIVMSVSEMFGDGFGY